MADPWLHIVLFMFHFGSLEGTDLRKSAITALKQTLSRHAVTALQWRLSNTCKTRYRLMANLSGGNSIR
jgi:hypothetical protein